MKEERQAARQGRHDEYDLQAQLVTSAWTRYMGIAAIVGMGVGIFGLSLVFVTFWETRTTAEAAMGQVKLMKATQRSDVRLQIHFETDETDGEQKVIVVAKSHAASEASMISIKDVVVSTSDGRFAELPLTQRSATGPEKLTHSGSARKFSYSNPAFVFPMPQMQSRAFDNLLVTVGATLEYTDCFGERQTKRETWSARAKPIGAPVTLRIQAPLVIIA